MHAFVMLAVVKPTTLGISGPNVSRLAFSCRPLGVDWGRFDEAAHGVGTRERVLSRALGGELTAAGPASSSPPKVFCDSLIVIAFATPVQRSGSGALATEADLDEMEKLVAGGDAVRWI